jgi:hypothetical protein
MGDTQQHITNTYAARILDATTAGRSMLTAADNAAQRTLLSVLSTAQIAAAYQPLGDYATGAEGDLATSAVQPGDLATVATSGSYNDLIDTPSGGGGNSFETIQPAIGGTNGTAVVADSSTDTLTLDTGCGMTITGDAASDKITLNAFGEEQPIAAFLGTIWETIPGIINATTAVGVILGRKYLIPWKCTKRRTITQMQISVTAGDSGDSATRVARLGIRNRNPVTGEPTTLVVDAGTVSVATNGHKVITGLSVTLDPGWYYLEMVSNGAPAIRAVSSATLQSTNMGIEATSTNTLTMVSGLYREFTYAALPADETGQTQLNHLLAAGNLPIIMVR